MCTRVTSIPKEIRKPIIAYKVLETIHSYQETIPSRLKSPYQFHEVQLGQLTKTTLSTKKFIAEFRKEYNAAKLKGQNLFVAEGAYHMYKTLEKAERYLQYSVNRVVVMCEVPAWSAVMNGTDLDNEVLVVNRYKPLKIISTHQNQY